ncbi:MAG: pyrroloquinoline quinone-dependent dehydrogenase [Parvibaculaceae bacterium]|nr:pyrroloquinoline quinone-dependent dehydrogenase [Parvibaculaceae bacterium]
MFRKIRGPQKPISPVTRFLFLLLLSVGFGAALSLPASAFEWSSYGGDEGGQRYAPFSQITAENVAGLEPVWTYQTGDLANKPEALARSALQVTPILAEGALYLCTPFNDVIALDPATGQEMWRFDPEVDEAQFPANHFKCRGVTFWRDENAAKDEVCAARIFSATADRRVIALDAGTGVPCNDFGEAGQVLIDPGIELLWPGEMQITSAPVVTQTAVVIGSAISDNARAQAPKGTVRAFDLRSGAPLWSFDPVVRDASAPYADTWSEEARATVGHANVWAPMSYDRERDTLFLPTSSPSPDFYGGRRLGDNRYANSVVALNGTTGAIKWHFQTVHHDVWDYDLPAQPTLITLEREGRDVDVVAQVTKTGFMFVLDRDTGEPFYEVEERPVPQTDVPGEVTSPTQPFPVAPPPFVSQRITPEDALGFVLFDKWACQDLMRSSRNEGLFTPPSLKGTIVYPFTGGGANWGGMGFDPERKIAIINGNQMAHLIKLIPRADFKDTKENRGHEAEVTPQAGTEYGMSRELLMSPLGAPCSPLPWGNLTAIDLNDGTIKWQQSFGLANEIVPAPFDLEFGTPSFGGPALTASGIFFIAGTMDQRLRAYDINTGEELWQHKLPAGGHATPMLYEWGGREYVVIAAGGSSFADTKLGDYIIAFALPERP